MDFTWKCSPTLGHSPEFSPGRLEIFTKINHFIHKNNISWQFWVFQSPDPRVFTQNLYYETILNKNKFDKQNEKRESLFLLV